MDYIYEVERLGYNPARAESIERYAQGLIGLTIREAVGEYAVEAKRNKGNLGQLIEKGFFGYENNNESLPDFYEAGVELKLTPFKKNKNGSYSAKERLIITMIDYMKVIYEDDLYTSHLWTKASKILLVEYLYKKDIKDTLDYKIKYATLFSPQREDLPTIEADYHIIVSKIQAGKAHELSEGDTYYLGAATKAQSSADRRQQPNSPEPAKPRAVFLYTKKFPKKILFGILKVKEYRHKEEKKMLLKLQENRGYLNIKPKDIKRMIIEKDKAFGLEFEHILIYTNSSTEYVARYQGRQDAEAELERFKNALEAGDEKFEFTTDDELVKKIDEAENQFVEG